jgi:HAE1 family hydrophobic/amphiphilic exporter-1
MAEGNVTVVLKPVAERTRNTGTIIREFRPEMEKIPGLISFTFGEPKMGGPEGEKPIQIDVSGDDYAVIDTICLDIYEKIKSVKGLKDLVSGVKAGRPEIKIEIDRERVRDLGQDPVTLAGMLRSYVFGTLAGKYKEANEEYDIRVEAVDRYKDEIEKIRSMEILLDKNKPVFLNQIAKVREDRMLSKVKRKNLKRVVSVQADIEGRSIQEIVDEINGILKTLVLPNGYAYTFGGEEEERREAFGNLFLALIAAVALVYMIMASQFEAIFSPFVIMFTIPLSIIGVFLSLNLYGFNFSITAMIGLIMLAGIVVNNGIILVDYIIRARAEGKDKWTAVRESALLRLRPILMTTMTTVLGMLPLSLGIGAGSDFYQPLAITVIGGLTFSTMMTLTYIPALYMVIDDIVEFASRFLRRFV